MHELVGFLRMLMRQSVSAVVTKCRRGTATDHKIQKVFENSPLTRVASLLFFGSREEAGPVPSAESVFFSGSTSQFSAVDDC